jgi:hypothetical protein
MAMESLIRVLVAVELLLLPPWVAASALGPERLSRRLLRSPAVVVLLAGVLLVLAALAGGADAVGVLRAQLVAFGFVVLLAGVAVTGERIGGPRFGQAAAALAGWLLLGSIFLAAPAAEMLDERGAAVLVRAAVHANPLVVAERALGFDWLHAELTYRHSPLGESYPVQGLAAWKTCLFHVFLGSALVVFGIPSPPKKRAGA